MPNKREFYAVDNVKIDKKKLENVSYILVTDNINFDKKKSEIDIELCDGGRIKMIGQLIYNKS